VIERPCEELDIPFFACRGYVSQSEQWRAGERIRERWEDHRQSTVILHLGDHDPSGIHMTEDIKKRLEMFIGGDLLVKRIALNYD